MERVFQRFFNPSINYFLIIHIKYFKPALTRGLTAHDCGGPLFVETTGQVPTFPSPKSDPGSQQNK